jgi:hypothetical protein
LALEVAVARADIAQGRTPPAHDLLIAAPGDRTEE